MTLKQQLFVNKYLEMGNGTAAAMEVYNTEKMNVAAEIAYENLRKPEIKNAINAYLTHKSNLSTYVLDEFVNLLKNGTGAQRLAAINTYFKIMGFK